MRNPLNEADYVTRCERETPPAVVALKQKAAGAHNANRLMSTEEFGAPGRI